MLNLSSVLVVFAALLSTFVSVESKCVITQDCTSGPTCRPRPVFENETEPFPLNWPMLQCPQYASSGCCSMDQNSILMVNFLGIQSAFSNIANGGCPGCAFNVMNFWCDYTCSPDQDKFVTVLGYQNVTDPTRGVIVEVLSTSLNVTVDFACAVYGSCEKVKVVQESSAMSNAEGFFNYQGQYEAIQHGVNIYFNYTDAPNSIDLATYTCCNFPTQYQNASAPNSSCPCAYCAGMCTGGSCAGSSTSNIGVLNLSVTNGFDGALVGGVWAGALGIGLFFIIRGYLQKRKSALAGEVSNALLAEQEGFSGDTYRTGRTVRA